MSSQQDHHVAPSTTPVIFSEKNATNETTTPVVLAEKPLDDHNQYATGTDEPTAVPRRGRIGPGYLGAISRWTLELVAIALSIAALIAIVAILKYYDGKPQPKFYKNITLNTIIAIFSTITKTAMLIPVSAAIGQMKWIKFAEREGTLDEFQVYDEATRGSFGSVKLLYRFKGRNLACFGAVIMLLTLAMDPFIQQVLKYSNRPVPNDNLAFMPRTEYFDLWSYGIQHGDFSPAITTESAIYSGLFSNNSNPETSSLPFTCSTGNCTFPNFPSLAICSKCADVTSKLSKECHVGQLNDGFNTTASLCTYTFPSDGSSSSSDNSTGETTGAGALSIKSPYDGPAMYSSSNAQPTLIDGFNASQAAIVGGVNLIWAPSTIVPFMEFEPKAMQCALYACIQQFSASVTGGKIKQAVLDEWHEVLPLPSAGQMYNFTTPPSHFNVSKTSTYMIGLKAVTGIGSWFMKNFDNNTVTVYSGGEGSGSYAIEALRPLWLATTMGSIPQVIANLASSLTLNIRTNPQLESYWSNPDDPTNDQPPITIPIIQQNFNGTTYKSEIFIVVNWGWIAFPAAIVLASVIFLVVTIVKNSTLHVQVWKSNALALLFHGLDSSARGVAHEADSNGDMLKTASRIPVTLKPTNEGLRLAHVSTF